MSIQERDNAANQQPAADTPIKEWSKPVLTIMAASSAENSPGGWPDSGIDYS